jgi:hypothetical protein
MERVGLQHHQVLHECISENEAEQCEVGRIGRKLVRIFLLDLRDLIVIET